MTRRGGIIKKGGRCGYGQNSFSRQYFEIFYLQYHIIFFPFPFPFPGMIHVPKIGEWIFSFPSSSRILGMFFFIPFPFPNSGNGFFQFPSRSRTSGMELSIPVPVPELPNVIPAHPCAAILLLPILRDDILLPFAPNFSVKFVSSRIKQLLWISPVNCPKEIEKGAPQNHIMTSFQMKSAVSDV